MRNLLDFLIRQGHWLLFLLLECICMTLLFRFNNYQGSVGFTSANWFIGQIYAGAYEISSFLSLKETNRQLTMRNIMLEAEVTSLKDKLNKSEDEAIVPFPDNQTNFFSSYRTIPARVINNSINKPDNYITLDKGKADGITKEMGVVNGNGIVGIVYMVSDHYSVAISLLNRKSVISCKFKENDYFGYLKWNGKDSKYALLEDLPRHALFEKGDTIVTSGYSAVFPKGVMVGTVDSIGDSKDGLSYLLRIRLATDFACLNDVVVIANEGFNEQQILESQIEK